MNHITKTQLELGPGMKSFCFVLRGFIAHSGQIIRVQTAKYSPIWTDMQNANSSEKEESSETDD